MSKRVLYHPEFGVYLGSCLGFGFWSKCDPVGQPCAVLFDSESEADKFIRSWNHPIENWITVPVEDDMDGYASIAACVKAGLPEWSADARNGES